jgi:RND family efflux transporter MFP subunit
MTLNSLKYAVFIISALLLSACAEQQAPEAEAIRPVRAMTVGDIAELERRNFPGRAKATQEVDLSFRVAGPLIALPVKVGDKLKKGDLAARIDPRDFEVQQRKAEGELERSVAYRERAKSEYERLLGIQKKGTGLVSEVKVERAKEDYQIAKADIAAYRASMDAAKDAVSYTHLKAPFDGAIVATYVENFEYVQARQSIVRLLDSTRVEFKFNVPETMISLIPQVADIRVRFDAFPDLEIPAEIKEIGSEASATTRTYPVTLIMDQPEGAEILPGMAGKVMGKARSQTGEDGVAILIPMSSVFSPESGDQSFVWVIDAGSNTVSRRAVKLGALGAAGVAVQEGLQAGELIAIAGVHFLIEGQQVRPELD